MKKFDFVIGNPPYQEIINSEASNSSLAKQLFPYFIRKSIEISDDQVMLITPSRWFTGDAQDKSFLKLRKFIKENNHIKIIKNFKNEKEVFQNAEIKGGVNYFLYKKNYQGKVKFINVQNGKESYSTRDLFESDMDIIISDEIGYGIISKVKNHVNFISFTKFTKGRNAFGIIGKISVLEELTSKDPFENSIEVRCKNNEIRWIDREKIVKNKDLIDSYKVFISKSAGNPNKDKKVIGMPYLGKPGSICTDSLIPVGKFDNQVESENLVKYMKTKFLRYLVSILKMSQNVTQIVYEFVPIQDFTEDSDIDWSQSIPEIDQQLYKKYNLSKDEIDFIEEKVQEMK